MTTRKDAADRMQYVTFTVPGPRLQTIERYAEHHGLTVSMAIRVLLGKVLNQIEAKGKTQGFDKAFDEYAEKPGERR